MLFIHSVTLVVGWLAVQTTAACYQDCTASFNEKIQQLVNIKDQGTLVLLSCEALSEQMICLESKRGHCDVTSLQYVNTILNFIRPDYQRTCASSLSSNSSNVQTPTAQLFQKCRQRAWVCFTAFNDTYTPALLETSKNKAEICGSLDNYTTCVEDLIPECGQFLENDIKSIRGLQMRHTHFCSAYTTRANAGPVLHRGGLLAVSTPQAVTECVNDTMDCYSDFNATFIPAMNQYRLADMCSSMDKYSLCLLEVHNRTECQRYTRQALAGIQIVKQQYSVYCGTDGGQQAQQCVSDFQACYNNFNASYFPAMHSANMDGICRSVHTYSECVQPLFTDCGFHIANALSSVRILKEQFSMKCNKEYQRLIACEPLLVCIHEFSQGFIPATHGGSNRLCQSLSAYFPCVEASLKKCNIPPEDTAVDFSMLGNLTGVYCQNLLGNNVLNTCPEFVTCTSGIILVSEPDPSAMFDASTWCAYMDMSLSCVDRAVHTRHCGIYNDDTINGHLSKQRNLKRKICNIPSEQRTAGHEKSGATTPMPAVVSLAAVLIMSLVP